MRHVAIGIATAFGGLLLSRALWWVADAKWSGDPMAPAIWIIIGGAAVAMSAAVRHG